MANFAQLLKEEIIRLSKKEIRAAMQPALNAIQTLRKANAEQKKQIAELERMFQKCSSSLPETKTPSDKKMLSFDKKTRLGAGGIIRIRKRLALDRQTMARLLDVNPNSIFLWEHEKNKPRPQMRMKILSLRDLTKKDIQERLMALPEIKTNVKTKIKMQEKDSGPGINKPVVLPEKKTPDASKLPPEQGLPQVRRAVIPAVRSEL